jgi:alkanesulfonate monooxygenase SsuD/methylene tetrahydromethanopterin reductase-like flavin-dependent oxidoreductase (luciferase family)
LELKKNGSPPASDSKRLPFVGNADQIASDIRQYQQLGVSSLVFDVAQQTQDIDLVLELLEEFATLVWPKV